MPPLKQRYFTHSPIKKDEDDKKEAKKKRSKPAKTQDVITFNVTNLKRDRYNRHAKEFTRKYQKLRSLSKLKPQFRGRAPIPEEALKKYSKGEGIDEKAIKTGIHRAKFEKKEKNIKFATEFAARTEILLTEETGFLEAEPGETTTQFTQNAIVKEVDITAAAKHFDLQLTDFGPYRCKYTKNGRHLVLGGKLGHVAAFDWVTKRLHCEMNVMESVHDVCWLHVETMFAVAQKSWVYIYDNQGIELHCIKRMNSVTRMEFLPYHFLLATCSDQGYLSWLDISLGTLVGQFSTNLGRLTMLCQNPWNATLCVGHAKGVVSFWSPNSREPLAKLLSHKAPMTALHVDPSGTYMATAASNRELKIWDIRRLEGPLQDYKLLSAPNNLNFSQKKLLGVGLGNIVQVYKDCCTVKAKRPYLRHCFNSSISNLTFCPFEDVLGVGTARGFTSLLVPGAGEPNFDAYEANPFQTKSQRREAEVKALLEKIQPELITLDPTNIGEIDLPTMQDKIEAKKKLLYVKAPKINYQPRNKAKGKGGSVKIARNKKIVQEEAKKKFKKTVKDLKQVEVVGAKKPVKKPHILDRFLSKKK